MNEPLPLAGGGFLLLTDGGPLLEADEATPPEPTGAAVVIPLADPGRVLLLSGQSLN